MHKIRIAVTVYEKTEDVLYLNCLLPLRLTSAIQEVRESRLCPIYIQKLQRFVQMIQLHPGLCL